jgi:L-ascorbate metabolism protein UlaG (beta-lactamase superfamily)
MKITKLGHCCLLIEVSGVRIITDPGNYSTSQNTVKDIDFVLISHEHPDHLHVDSLKNILENNSKAVIISNQSVSRILNKENITHKIVSDKDVSDMKGVSLKGWGTKHANIYKEVEDVENTGYIIADKLFYPGDALTLLDREIDILALPVAGPWIKISEAIEYALAVKPKKCFPVHDGNLKWQGAPHRLPKNALTKAGIDFVILLEGQTEEF